MEIVVAARAGGTAAGAGTKRGVCGPQGSCCRSAASAPARLLASAPCLTLLLCLGRNQASQEGAQAAGQEQVQGEAQVSAATGTHTARFGRIAARQRGTLSPPHTMYAHTRTGRRPHLCRSRSRDRRRRSRSRSRSRDRRRRSYSRSRSRDRYRSSRHSNRCVRSALLRLVLQFDHRQGRKQ